jgi:hypothetical protein
VPAAASVWSKPEDLRGLVAAALMPATLFTIANDHAMRALSFPSNRGGFLYVAGWPGVILA